MCCASHTDGGVRIDSKCKENMIINFLLVIPLSDYVCDTYVLGCIQGKMETIYLTSIVIILIYCLVEYNPCMISFFTFHTISG